MLVGIIKPQTAARVRELDANTARTSEKFSVIVTDPQVIGRIEPYVDLAEWSGAAASPVRLH